MQLNIFPAPRSVRRTKSIVDVTDADWIVLPAYCSNRLQDRIRQQAANISAYLNRPIRVSASAPEQGSVLLRVDTGGRLEDQAYELTVSAKGCTVVSGSESGAFYGCMAFAELVAQCGAQLPGLTIKDAPDIAARGVMLDVSRCKVPTMDTLKQLIDRLASMRINEVQLYIEHTFAFSAHKNVWHDASPFTHEEILEIDRYCTDRFMELVPNLNSFGHFGRYLQHPELRHLAECPDNRFPDCLAPNAASLKFLEELYDEYLPNFSSTLLNVGCDETWELGKGRSKRRADKTSVTTVYVDFLKKIHRLCAKKGMRMQFWGDIILHQPELVKELPKDIIALSWGYEAKTPFAKEAPIFAGSGLDFYVCPGTSAWNSITGRTDNCLANLQNAARNGAKHGAIGFLNTDWGDGGHHQTLPISYVGFAAGAAYSWCLKSNRDVDLAGALDRHMFDDASGMLGQFCLDIGQTLNRMPGLERQNCSCINQLLFTNPERLDISKITRSQYDRAEAWLDKLTDDLSLAMPLGSDSDLVMNELRHTVAMSRYAINRGRYKQFGAVKADTLRAELQSLIMSHEEQWLARNRRGGLHESSARLRKSAELFEG